MPGPRTAPRSRWTPARWSRSLGRDHRASIPEGAGPGSRPAAGHLTTAVRPAPRRHITSAVKAVVMARKQRAPDYTGALAELIYLDRNEIVDQALARIVQKIPLLFEHYKVNPHDKNCWQRLAIRLALAHVPGLKVSMRRGGRKPIWKGKAGR